jgi:hypothetical protein
MVQVHSLPRRQSPAADPPHRLHDRPKSNSFPRLSSMKRADLQVASTVASAMALAVDEMEVAATEMVAVASVAEVAATDVVVGTEMV